MASHKCSSVRVYVCALGDYIIVAVRGRGAEPSPIVKEDSQETECVIKKENKS